MWLKSSFLDVNSQLHSVQTCTLVIVNTLVGGIDALPVHSGFPKSPGRTRGFSRPFSAPGDAVAAATAPAGPCSTRKCGPPLRSCGTSCDPASGKLPPGGLVTDTSRNGSFATSSLCPCPCSSAGIQFARHISVCCLSQLVLDARLEPWFADLAEEELQHLWDWQFRVHHGRCQQLSSCQLVRAIELLHMAPNAGSSPKAIALCRTLWSCGPTRYACSPAGPRTFSDASRDSCYYRR